MRLLVVGAGGHAKVVIDAAEAAGHTIAAVLGSTSDVREIMGHPVTTPAEAPDIAALGADGFIVAIGDNRTRARRFAELTATGLAPATVIHPSAIVGTDVVIGPGTFLAPGVIVNTGARIGVDVILNTGCAVDHDVEVGDHSHVGPRTALCGGAAIGEGALLGVGSCVVPLARVGAWSVVGAGAAVVGDLPGGSVCVGVPARAIHTSQEADRG